MSCFPCSRRGRRDTWVHRAGRLASYNLVASNGAFAHAAPGESESPGSDRLLAAATPSCRRTAGMRTRRPIAGSLGRVVGTSASYMASHVAGDDGVHPPSTPPSPAMNFRRRIHHPLLLCRAYAIGAACLALRPQLFFAAREAGSGPRQIPISNGFLNDPHPMASRINGFINDLKSLLPGHTCQTLFSWFTYRTSPTKAMIGYMVVVLSLVQGLILDWIDAGRRPPPNGFMK
jgi:hypothetical protein